MAPRCAVRGWQPRALLSSTRGSRCMFGHRERPTRGSQVQVRHLHLRGRQAHSQAQGEGRHDRILRALEGRRRGLRRQHQQGRGRHLTVNAAPLLERVRDAVSRSVMFVRGRHQALAHKVPLPQFALPPLALGPPLAQSRWRTHCCRTGGLLHLRTAGRRASVAGRGCACRVRCVHAHAAACAALPLPYGVVAVARVHREMRDASAVTAVPQAI